MRPSAAGGRGWCFEAATRLSLPPFLAFAHPGVAEALSDCGNLLVAAPVLLVAAALFWRSGARRAAAALPAILAAAVLVGGLLRLAFRTVALAPLAAALRFTANAPSGHAIVAIATYGTLGGIALRGTGLWRLSAVPAAAILAGVCVTRVTLGYHSLTDVAAGLLAGSPFAVAMLRVTGSARPALPPLYMACAATLVLMLLTRLRFDSNAMF